MNQAKILVTVVLAWTSSCAFGQLPDRDKTVRPKSSTGSQLLDVTDSHRPQTSHTRPPKLDAFSRDEWRRIDGSIKRAPAWIASQQNQDGSFPTLESGQPGVTSLCIMAFLSAGHVPSEGPYGDKLDRAIEYALGCQRADGLFSAAATNVPVTEWDGPTHTATYNHAITGLMFGEVYGSGGLRRSQQVATAIEKAIALTRKLQLRSRRYGVDSGGWRYLEPVNYSGAEQSDLSMTGWQLMFLRSAMNAGFDIPSEYMTEATDYVKRCFNRQSKQFFYGIRGHHPIATRAVTGSGLLCLFLSGTTDPEIEQAAGDWMLAHPFMPYNGSINYMDRYHYGTYYCSQAAFQLGGDDWATLYRRISEALLTNQHPDGSWDAESRDTAFGNVYSSALVVLTLTPPYQLLPIYQR